MRGSIVLTTWNEKSNSPTKPFTRRISLSTSPTIQRVDICKTANAANPGSLMCLMLKISLSSASSRFEKLYGRGVLRYGGSGCRLVMLADKRHSRDVTSWVVTLAVPTSRRKSCIQAELVSSSSSSPRRIKVSDAYPSKLR